MKKVLLGVFVLCALVTVATGCEKKNNEETTTTTVAAEQKLNCSVAIDGGTTRINVTYKEGKIYSTSYYVSEKLESEAAAKKKYETGKEEIKEINTHKGISASVSQSGSLYSTNLSFTIEKFDDYAKEQYEDIFKEIKDKTYDENKDALTKAGYTCK